MVCCYNSAANNPYKESHHPGYTPLSKVDDSRVVEVGLGNAALSAVEFAKIDEDDHSAKLLTETAED